MTGLGFWQFLDKPFVGLAPMDGVTDYPFRYIQKKYGQPDVVFTEFTSVEGLCRGASKVITDFLYDQTQRPIVAQIYGVTPNFFRQTAVLLSTLGFDGIDINMGCPSKSVSHGGAGAALIKTPKLAQQIIQATKQGVKDWQEGRKHTECPALDESVILAVSQLKKQFSWMPQNKKQSAQESIPISVKTRIGYDSPSIADWIPQLLEVEPAVISVHGRTLRQGYSGQADWGIISQVVKLAQGSGVLIIGNGDVVSRTDAQEKAQQSGADGVLIGRASFGNPFVFKSEDIVQTQPKLAAIALEHAQLFEKTYQHLDKYSFFPMRKHLGWYIKGVPRAREIRSQLVRSSSSLEVKSILRQHDLL